MDSFIESDQEKDCYNSFKGNEHLGQIGSITHVSEDLWMSIVDWLMKVHNGAELPPSILYRTINIFGRSVSRSTDLMDYDELCQLGFASMVLASKYEDICDLKMNLFLCIPKPDKIEELWKKEELILMKLQWNLTVPNPYYFLFVRFIKFVTSDEKMENMNFFFAELGQMLYGVMILKNPSMIAASALYAARCTLKESPAWNETLERHTEYSESDIKHSAKLMVRFHTGAATRHDLKAVYDKFSSPKWSSVALCQPAMDLLED
ncbi:Cyclin [Macleaya cordata]|uniref:Cyclin n=1 Tax=Macleaya cordata TaxID=56857 RepID=A0A200QAD1_MACCD|nr:Cyclin [Macleaya cordata]